MVRDRLNMGNILRLGLAASLLFFAAWASAAQWRTVGANERLKIEMDDASLKRAGKIVEAWDRETYAKPEQAAPGDFYFSSVKTFSRYGCDLRLTEMLMQVYYAEDGAEIKRIIGSGDDGRPGYVVPDSTGEWKFNYACTGKLAGQQAAAPKAKKKTPAKPKVKKPAKNGATNSKASLVPCGDQGSSGKPASPAKPAVRNAKAVPKKTTAVPMRAVPVLSPEPVTTLDSLTKKAAPAKKP